MFGKRSVRQFSKCHCNALLLTGTGGVLSLPFTEKTKKQQNQIVENGITRNSDTFWTPGSYGCGDVGVYN